MFNKRTAKKNIYPEEKIKIIQNIAYASIKYADLSTLRTNSYKFSFDKMLLFNGNTATYQLYNYTRAHAIIKKAEKIISPEEFIFNIVDIDEINICKLLLRFPEVIENVSINLEFHHLCNYLYNLTVASGKFYTKCKCLISPTEVNRTRLSIWYSTRNILEQCFHILGINKLEKM